MLIQQAVDSGRSLKICLESKREFENTDVFSIVIIIRILREPISASVQQFYGRHI